MALQGRFDADFSTFFAACRQAEVSLKGFDAGSRQVESSLNRMVDSFTGREVITQANLMAEAVGRIGGPARLSQTELARVGAVASEAADKFRRWGQEVPPNIARLEVATKGASTGMTGMAKAIADTDNVLGLFGVQLGPARKALDDLGQASGKTASQIGLIGTASLAAGAAVGGWQFGRWIAGWAETDQIIGDVTAKLLGFGDVAGQKAAASQDVLARASKTAGRSITDLSEAMKINQAEAQRMIAANQKSAETFTAEAAAATSAAAIIESNRKKMYDIEFEFAKAQSASAAQRAIDEAAAADAATQKLYAEIDAATKLNAEHKKLRDAGVEGQGAIGAATDQTTAALERQRAAAAAAAAAATAAAAAIVQQVSTLENAKDREKRLADEAKARGATTYASFDDPTQAAAMLARPDRSLEDFIRIYGGYSGGLEFAQKQYQIDQEIRRRAQAVLDKANAEGYLGPGSTNRGGTVTVNISGVMDPRTITELTTAVGKEMVKRSGTKVGI